MGVALAEFFLLAPFAMFVFKCESGEVFASAFKPLFSCEVRWEAGADTSGLTFSSLFLRSRFALVGLAY